MSIHTSNIVCIYFIGKSISLMVAHTHTHNAVAVVVVVMVFCLLISLLVCL